MSQTSTIKALEKPTDIKQVKKIIGVDFGTSNTTIAYINDASFISVLSEVKFGKTMIPSVVAFDGTKFLFGPDALNLKPDGKTTFVWRYLKKELGVAGKTYKFTSKTGQIIEVTSQDLIVKYLKYIQDNIFEHTDHNAFGTMISCPANFDQDKKVMLQNCFTLAGFDLVGLLSEPTAACIFYGQNNFFKEGEKIMVIDIGGGTTDIAVVDFGKQRYETLPTSGNSNLGGSDFTQRLYDFVCDDLKQKLGGKFKELLTPSLSDYIFEVVEQVKLNLSFHTQDEIILSRIVPTTGGAKTWNHLITRQEFEKLTQDLVDKLLHPIVECLEFNNLNAMDIKKILLVGGAAATWGLYKTLKEKFSWAEIILDSNAKFCVSKGNAIYCSYQKEFQKSIIIEKINKSIGVLATDPNNPDEPLDKRKVIRIIHRGDDIPAYGTYEFRTSEHNQKDAKIILVQGEGYTMDNCTYIGTVVLDNIGIARAGINKINVALKVNDMGLLTVWATDSIKNKTQELQIKLDHSWTAQDFAKLQKSIEQQKTMRAKEYDDRQYTKFVKIYNKFYTKLQTFPKEMAIRPHLEYALKELKQAIKEKHWKLAAEIVDKYHHIAKEVQWN